MGSRLLDSVVIGADAHITDSPTNLALRAMLDGERSLLPLAAADDDPTAESHARALGAGSPIDDDIALVVATSGSTGTPKGAMLTADALAASAAATHQVLGGPGAWLLALPAHHIAGLQVILRSIQAGFEPVAMDVGRGFSLPAFRASAAALRGPRRYVSLVPTQLIKILDDPAATTTLASFDGVLIGGAATPAMVYRRAVDAGIALRRTYGMSETCGGCVYDGIALPGTTIDLDNGRVCLAGPTLAREYRNLPNHPAFSRPGWFRTDDLGEFDDDGRLRIIGRADDAIITGGLTVVPQVVEEQIMSVPQVAQCAVFGVADDRLGQRVAAAIVLAAQHDCDDDWNAAIASVTAHITTHLGARAVPREFHRVTELPLRGPGKVDRRRLQDQCERR